jgi:hypothetical protein
MLPDTNSLVSSRDEESMEVAIRRRRPRLFWMLVEGWLRQRVRDGRDDFDSDVVFVATELSYKNVNVFFFFQEYKLL